MIEVFQDQAMHYHKRFVKELIIFTYCSLVGLAGRKILEKI